MTVVDVSAREPPRTIDNTMTARRQIGSPEEVTAVAFRTYGRQIVQSRWVPGDTSWTLRTHDVETGRAILNRTDLPGTDLRFAFSQNGERLATVSSTLPPGAIAVWDVARVAEIAKLNVNADSTTQVALDDDGDRLATATGSDVSVWNVASRIRIVRLDSAAPIRRLAFQSDKLVATTSEGKEVSWSLPSGKRTDSLVGADVQSSPYGNYRAVSTTDGVQIEGPRLGRPFTISGPLKMHSAAFQSDGRRLVTGDDDGEIRVWDVVSQRILVHWFRPEPPTLLALSRDGKMVAAALGSTALEIWHTSPRNVCEEPGSKIPTRAIRPRILSLAFSPAGNRIAVGLYTKGVQIWDATTCSLVAQESSHESAFGVDFSPDGLRIARSGDATAIMDAKSGVLLEPLNSNEATLGSIAWSPNESEIATAEYLWSAKTKFRPQGLQRSRAFGERERIEQSRISHFDRNVAFSPDGLVLATPGNAGSVNLWDPSGKRLTGLYGIEGAIKSLVFTENGKQLLLVLTDKWRLYQYPVRVEDVVAEADRRFPGPLDAESCARALGLRACPDFLLDSR